MGAIYLKGVPLRRRLQLQSKVDHKTGCRNWIGAGNWMEKTRPRVKVHGKKILASRAIWELYRGKIPEGLCVLHKCDNGKCIAIKHLYLGTKKDNMRDFLERNPKAKNIIRKLGSNGTLVLKLFWASKSIEERKKIYAKSLRSRLRNAR